MAAVAPTYAPPALPEVSHPWNPSEVLHRRRPARVHAPVSPASRRVPLSASSGQSAPVYAPSYAPAYAAPYAPAPSYRPHTAPAPASGTAWRLLAFLLIAAATVLLSYAGWQSFGSDLYTSWTQSRLEDATPSLLVENPAFILDSGRTAAPLAEVPTLALGSTFGTISVPKIDLDYKVVVGTGVEELKAGPGWMVGTSFPGQPGNAVISGHRTTYGGPFNRLDELVAGDLIEVHTASGGLQVYEVRDSFVVYPEDSWVAAPTDGVRLTLTTCTPEGSAAQRLIIQAELLSGANADKALSVDDWARSAPGA